VAALARCQGLWHYPYMPKRSSKPNVRRKATPKPDENEVAFMVMRAATEALAIEAAKNPHAVALGRLGGLKGGQARAQKLTPKRRADIAQKAAAARWGKTVR
jgi:hypothetical protein